MQRFLAFFNVIHAEKVEIVQKQLANAIHTAVPR